MFVSRCVGCKVFGSSGKCWACLCLATVLSVELCQRVSNLSSLIGGLLCAWLSLSLLRRRGGVEANARDWKKIGRVRLERSAAMIVLPKRCVLSFKKGPDRPQRIPIILELNNGMLEC